MTLPEWITRIAADREFRGEDLRVLLVLMVHTETYTARITQSEIARLLGLNVSNVSRAIRKLSQKSVITKEMNAGKTTGYRFLLP